MKPAIAAAPLPPLDFFVIGHPVTQGSKTLSPRGHMYESARGWRAWRRAIAQTALVARNRAGANERKWPLTEPVALTLEFRILRPRHSKLDYPRQDLDKLVRAVGDGLVAGGILADDSQIVALVDVGKRWAQPGEPCGCAVKVSETTARNGLVEREVGDDVCCSGKVGRGT